MQKCFFLIKVPLNPFASLSHHLVARVYESKAEFRSALQHEKEGYTIYKNQVTSVRAAHLCPIALLPETSSAAPCSSGRPLTNASEQTPGNLCSWDGAQLLPCTVIDHVLPQKSSSSLPASLLLLYPVAGQELLLVARLPFWLGTERAGAALPTFCTACLLNTRSKLVWSLSCFVGSTFSCAQPLVMHSETSASARALSEHVCSCTR